LAILNNSLDFVINNNNIVIIATKHAMRVDKQSGDQRMGSMKQDEKPTSKKYVNPAYVIYSEFLIIDIFFLCSICL